MVSIIIPVFETEEYLEQCLDSVVNQSYAELEIIIILGKGHDNSEKICDAYAKKDKRILVFEQNGTGAGSARNQGVTVSTGDYICFVDSDDWIEPTFVEKLVCTMKTHDAEVVECDYFWYPNGIKRIAGNSPYECIDHRVVGILGAPACWKLMYKRSMWNREGLMFSNTVAEDLYLYSNVLRVCKGYHFVKEALYHYRDRTGGFTDSSQKSLTKYRELYGVFEEIVDCYKKRGLWNQYREDLYRQLLPHAIARFRIIRKRINDEESEILKQECQNFFMILFNKKTNSFNRKIAVLGSYSLSRIGNYFTVSDARDVSYVFSSIISIMSESGKMEIHNSNPYRQKMLERENKRSFIYDIKHNTPDVLLIDLLEERFNILAYGNCYYTMSDALAETECVTRDAAIIKRMGEECDQLWQTACDQLVDLMNNLSEKCTIICVENYLSECIGDIYNVDSYEDKKIALINRKLKEYYTYLTSKCARIKMIKNTDIPNCIKYTEKGFEFGSVPEHYNSYYYGIVANMIMDMID